jgi:hypothetical protein
LWHSDLFDDDVVTARSVSVAFEGEPSLSSVTDVAPVKAQHL